MVVLIRPNGHWACCSWLRGHVVHSVAVLRDLLEMAGKSVLAQAAPRSRRRQYPGVHLREDGLIPLGMSVLNVTQKRKRRHKWTDQSEQSIASPDKFTSEGYPGELNVARK